MLAKEMPRTRTANQAKAQPIHDSTQSTHANTTQYINHGVNCAGSFAFSALYEANTGKAKLATELGRRRYVVS
jgi:hypothetical protein